MSQTTNNCKACDGDGWLLTTEYDAMSGVIDSRERLCDRCPSTLPETWLTTSMLLARSSG